MHESWVFYAVLFIAFLYLLKRFVDWRIRRNVPTMIRDARYMDKLAREAQVTRAKHDESEE